MGTDPPPTLSAPIGHRSILGEVRAAHPPRLSKLNTLRTSQDVSARSSSAAARKIGGVSLLPKERAETINRGYTGGRSAQIGTFDWLSAVKVLQPRDTSSGPHNGRDSGTASRINSRSRPPSAVDPSMAYLEHKTKSSSSDRGEEERRDLDANQSLQEESAPSVYIVWSPLIR